MNVGHWEKRVCETELQGDYANLTNSHTWGEINNFPFNIEGKGQSVNTSTKTNSSAETSPINECAQDEKDIFNHISG